MIGVKEYLFDRREGFLNRWHAENTIRSESLAEHQFFVARNAMLLCNVLASLKIAYPEMTKVVAIALHHDEAEKVVGDMPGPVKREYPMLKEVLTRVEAYALQDHVYNTDDLQKLSRRNPAFENLDIEHDIELQIVKYIDVLDAHIFAQIEVNMGNRYQEDTIRRTGEWMKAMQWPWLLKLRETIDLP